jgi:hypothetical protein
MNRAERFTPEPCRKDRNGQHGQARDAQVPARAGAADRAEKTQRQRRDASSIRRGERLPKPDNPEIIEEKARRWFRQGGVLVGHALRSPPGKEILKPDDSEGHFTISSKQSREQPPQICAGERQPGLCRPINKKRDHRQDAYTPIDRLKEGCQTEQLSEHDTCAAVAYNDLHPLLH